MTAIRIIRKLQQLLDVDFTSLMEDDVPAWDADAGKFINRQRGSGSAGISRLINLLDVAGTDGAGKAPVSDGADTFTLTDIATQAELDAHAADTMAVHGIADTSVLETTTGAQAKADAAEAAAEAASIPIGDLDVDGTLAADSDTKVPSQKAVKTYVDANAGGSQTLAEVLADGNDANALAIINLADPTNAQDADTKAARDAAISVLSATYQPLDSDLTAVAALTTTTFGRALLTLADAAALRSDAGLVIGTDVEAHDADLTTIAGLVPTNDDVLQRKAGAWTNRTMAQLIADLAALGTTFQPLDSDLTSIAALATTAFGRGLLTAANASALGIAAADVGAIATSALDTDGTLAANSDSKVASQKATKTYVDAHAATASTDGWIDDSAETWTFASFTAGPPAIGTFTVPGDVTAKYTKATRIKLTQTTVKFFVVAAAPIFDGTNTTVTITGGTDFTLANATISANFHSYVANPQGFPTSFAFNPNSTGYSSKTTDTGLFSIVGGMCQVWESTVGTSNAATWTWQAPIAPLQQQFGPAGVSTSTTSIGRYLISAGATTVTMGASISASGGFPTSGNKGATQSLPPYAF